MVVFVLSPTVLEKVVGLGATLNVLPKGGLPSPCCCCLVSSRVQLCDPMDHSPPGSSVHGISQARTLEWVAISYLGASS